MSADERYGPWLIRIHWLTLLRMIAVYATIEIREFFPRGSALRVGLKDWHYALGLSVFALAWLRLALRLARRAPPIVPAVAAWQSRLGAAVHLALYAFLLSMPLLGWLALSAEGEPPAFLGFALPALTAPDHALAELLEELHETIGTLGYWLIGLHAAAALVHHYALRDNTLVRMLPRAAKS
jgi:cytochrome b561